MKNRSLKKIIQLSFALLIITMTIPTVYSVIVLQTHKAKYDNIITNVNEANRISKTASEEVTIELWNIVCGKKNFMNGQQYLMIRSISNGLSSIQKRTSSPESQEKLEVASRALTTLLRNVISLENEMEKGSSVSENETRLDEIRTITALFSDLMQNYIVSEIESANITNEAIKRSSLILTLLQFLIISLSLNMAVHTYFSVSKSLNNALNNMQKFSSEIAQGHLDARTTIPNVLELHPLAENMNSMAEQINLLIQKNIEEQKNFQKAEMKALQAQITPHFLYNTFDTIIWLAEEEDTERVVKITKAFSEFLRISLSKGHEWITIQQELDHISHYLTIQKIRYNDILNYELSVNPELMDFKIIKLVLQPLIENAIYHGIKNKRGRGHIEVSVDFTDETKRYIKFSVKDDGAGFTAERLAQVNQELQTDTRSTEQLNSVYGLYNVHKKLCLYYGDETEGLKIESEQNKGAIISFIIPCVTTVESNGEQNV